MSWTHEQKLAWQRAHRAANGNIETRRYEKTISGFLMRAYRNMLSRVKGIQPKGRHHYVGLSILPRKEFYALSKGDPVFSLLYHQWKDAGYIRVLTPSVNRINSREGYTNYNIEWLTLAENSRLGSVSRFSRAIATD
jgi:hypothetical protein